MEPKHLFIALDACSSVDVLHFIAVPRTIETVFVRVCKGLHPLVEPFDL
jgi:hypothetical protein